MGMRLIFEVRCDAEGCRAEDHVPSAAFARGLRWQQVRHRGHPIKWYCPRHREPEEKRP